MSDDACITDKVVSLARICVIVGRPRSTIYRWTRDGQFPQPLACGGYSLREFLEWWELQKGLRPVVAPPPVRPLGKRALAKAQEIWRTGSAPRQEAEDGVLTSSTAYEVCRRTPAACPSATVTRHDRCRRSRPVAVIHGYRRLHGALAASNNSRS